MYCKVYNISSSSLTSVTTIVSTHYVEFQEGMEPLPTAVQLCPTELESLGRAGSLLAAQRVLLEERGAGGEGPQGVGAALRGGEVQHAHLALPLRDIRLHHARRNPGLNQRMLPSRELWRCVQARLEIGPYDMAVHTPAFFRQNLVSSHHDCLQFLRLQKSGVPYQFWFGCTFWKANFKYYPVEEDAV